MVKMATGDSYLFRLALRAVHLSVKFEQNPSDTKLCPQKINCVLFMHMLNSQHQLLIENVDQQNNADTETSSVAWTSCSLNRSLIVGFTFNKKFLLLFSYFPCYMPFLREKSLTCGKRSISLASHLF